MKVLLDLMRSANIPVFGVRVTERCRLSSRAGVGKAFL